MNVDLSLIIATKRWDGLDITLNHAKRLRFNETWELVLVDEFRNERHNLVEMWAKEHDINLIHVRPKTKKDIDVNPLPRTIVDYGNAYNTGLLYANGEIVVLIEDFIGFKSDFIQNHYDFLKKAGKEFHCLGPTYFLSYIPIEKRPSDITTLGCEGNVPRPNCSSYKGIPITVHLGYRPANASTYLENYIKINGFDERYDAAGWTDKEGIAMHRCAGYDNTAEKMNETGTFFHMEDSVPNWHMDHGPIDFPARFVLATPVAESRLANAYIELHSLATDADFWTKFCNLPVHFNLAEERRKLRC